MSKNDEQKTVGTSNVKQTEKPPTHTDLAGDSGRRVEDGTKEGGVVTKDVAKAEDEKR